MDLAQPTLTPKRDHFKLYKMNRVNKTNWIYIYIYILHFFACNPKRDLYG